MTVPAARHGSRVARPRIREIRRGLLVAGAFATCSSPAAAQVGAAASILTDDRFRGYSLSDGRPVGKLDLSYDDQSGLYGALSASIVASRDEGLQPHGLILNAGYAKRLFSGITLDSGITHSEYSSYSYRAATRSYTEVYAGLSGKYLAARIYASPDYLKHGTVYGELGANLNVTAKLRLVGHFGLLIPLREDPHEDRYGSDVDWRIGVTRQLGSVSIGAAWTAVRPGHDLYREHHRRDALVLSLTYAL